MSRLVTSTATATFRADIVQSLPDEPFRFASHDTLLHNANLHASVGKERVRHLLTLLGGLSEPGTCPQFLLGCDGAKTVQCKA